MHGCGRCQGWPGQQPAVSRMLPQNGETPCFPPQALKLLLAKAPRQLSQGCNSEASLDITLIFFPFPLGEPGPHFTSPWNTATWICLGTHCNGAAQTSLWCRGCAGEEGHHQHWGTPRTCTQPLHCNGVGKTPPARRFGQGDIFKDLSRVAWGGDARQTGSEAIGAGPFGEGTGSAPCVCPRSGGGGDAW